MLKLTHLCACANVFACEYKRARLCMYLSVCVCMSVFKSIYVYLLNICLRVLLTTGQCLNIKIHLYKNRRNLFKKESQVTKQDAH